MPSVDVSIKHFRGRKWEHSLHMHRASARDLVSELKHQQIIRLLLTTLLSGFCERRVGGQSELRFYAEILVKGSKCPSDY